MREIDFRSDTVTKPSVDMLEAISTTELGDDVYREDPAVNELELKAAQITRKEESLFVASGTMANLIAILAHVDRGGEIIVGNKSHIFVSEAGGASALGGGSYHVIPNNPRGVFDIEDIEIPGMPYDETARLIMLAESASAFEDFTEQGLARTLTAPEALQYR